MSGALNSEAAAILRKLLIDLGQLTTDLDLVVSDPDSAWPGFKGLMPDSPDNCVAIRDTAGRAEGRVFTGYLFEKHACQVLLRSAGLDGAVKGSRIQQALNLIHNTEVTVTDDYGTATSDYNVQSVMPTTVVTRLGLEQATSHRYRWSFNVLMSVRLTS